MADYELVGSSTRIYSWWRIGALICVYCATSTIVYLTWNSLIYDDSVHYPPPLLQADIPERWYKRAIFVADSVHPDNISHDIRLLRNQTLRAKATDPKEANSQDLLAPLNSASVISAKSTANQKREDGERRLVCYYSLPTSQKKFDNLRLADVRSKLCTHINIGMCEVSNASIVITDQLKRVLETDVPVLRLQNPALKLLLWVGGGEANSRGFADMVKNHGTRKVFIQSLKRLLRQYRLDGIDLDWEFPSAYNKERQHLSQLLYEIKAEYRREKRNYLLSVAVAAPEGIALFAYDVRELNTYADYVNVMTYDYHFYTRGTPFTGLNAPLFARHSEQSIWATLNVNASVSWWMRNGLDRKKLVVGLPLYGHSFTLVNPFNNRIGAPAQNVGQCGNQGFTSFSEVCWFDYHNLVSMFYDEESCSPYLSGGNEWISFENVKSIECKTRYVRANDLGGVMVFSLNTDDFKNVCNAGADAKSNATFPLVEAVNRVLFSSEW